MTSYTGQHSRRKREGIQNMTRRANKNKEETKGEREQKS
jgi:hypothetical protein